MFVDLKVSSDNFNLSKASVFSKIIIGDRLEDQFPNVYPKSPYIVCDNVEQAINYWKEVEGKFIISCSPVYRNEQSESGGWRWCKWWPYVGEKTPQADYLYNEDDIEMVLCCRISSIK